MPMESRACPFLIPVTADHLWMYPLGAYCRRPDARVRVISRTTVVSQCAGPWYQDCEGYREALAPSGSNAPRSPS